MFELMLINQILESKSLDVLRRYGVKIDYFLTLRNELNSILLHYNQYGQVPSKETFLALYPTFDIINVTESMEHIAYKIKEAYTFSKTQEILQQVSNKIEKDSIEGINVLKGAIEELISSTTETSNSKCDIITNALTREEIYHKRRDTDGEKITTGIDELDKILFGWMNEDLVTIFARTNEGKSWILLYFLTVAWSIGKKVLLYSGEMNQNIVGYRFDTLYKHFSNTGLMQGKAVLGSGVTDRDYGRYIKDLATKDGFIVITPRELGGKPTVYDIERLMQQYNVDIVGLDQLTLMADMRHARDKRTQYTNITEDLMILTERLQKPILLVTQARRDNNKNKADKENPPELDEIYESDGIAQNSTRVISMKCTGRVLKLAIKKNRYGEKDKDVFMMWDKDKGILKPLIQTTSETTEEELQEEYGF
ncbi:MAG: DnaB-like helicase C-terminal domain-containing protein [Cetobacterium sp.]